MRFHGAVSTNVDSTVLNVRMHFAQDARCATGGGRGRSGTASRTPSVKKGGSISAITSSRRGTLYILYESGIVKICHNKPGDGSAIDSFVGGRVDALNKFADVGDWDNFTNRLLSVMEGSSIEPATFSQE